MSTSRSERSSPAHMLAAEIQALRNRRLNEESLERELRKEIEDHLGEIDRRIKPEPRYANLPHTYEEHRRAVRKPHELARTLRDLILLKARQSLEKEADARTARVGVASLSLVQTHRDTFGSYQRAFLGSLPALDEAVARLRRDGFICAFGYRFKVNDDYDDRDRSYGTFEDRAFSSYAEEGIRGAVDDWIDISLPTA